MRRQISKAEWDFAKCPPAQLNFCFYYEYFRASELVRNFIRNYRKADIVTQKKVLDWEFMDLVHELPQDMHRAPPFVVPDGDWAGRRINATILNSPALSALVALEEFPETPWLEISSEKRNDLCSIRVEVDPPDEVLSEFSPWHSQTSVVLSFTCASNVEEVIKSMADTLRSYAKTHPERFRQRARRGGHADLLRQLGALKLLNLYEGDLEQAQAHAGYSEKRAFLTAVNKAKETLAVVVRPGK